MIGYYIHHHGNGHLARATVVARAVASRSGEPVVALSSLPEPADHPFAAWVRLAPDERIEQAWQPAGGGALHWAPLNSDGYRERMRTITAWATAERPRLAVVDVSVEVTLALRVIGTPVVVTAMPGDRTDDAHTLAYRLATAIIAPWQREIYAPRYLDAFADKTTFVGAFSRFDATASTEVVEPGRVLVLFGSGGGGPSRDLLDTIGASTGRSVVGFGGAGLPWIDDVWSQLCRAEIVLTHGGMNALAEVAAAAPAAIVLPQDRPFGEQRATTTALADADVVAALDGWPPETEWPALFDAAAARGGTAWKRWNDGAGADRFARVLAEVAMP